MTLDAHAVLLCFMGIPVSLEHKFQELLLVLLCRLPKFLFSRSLDNWSLTEFKIIVVVL